MVPKFQSHFSVELYAVSDTDHVARDVQWTQMQDHLYCIRRVPILHETTTTTG